MSAPSVTTSLRAGATASAPLTVQEVLTAPAVQQPLAGEVQEAVLCALSRLLFDGRKAPPGPSWSVCRLLDRYAHQPVGQHPAPVPSVVAGQSRPARKTALRRMELMPRELAERWRDLLEHESLDARFDDELLACAVPRDLWPVLAAMAADGPALAKRRLQLVLNQLSREEPATSNRRRLADRTGRPGRLSSSVMVESTRQADAMLDVMESLCEHDSGLFEQ